MVIGDIVLTLYDNRTIDAIGVVQGDYEWLDNMEKLPNGEGYRRSRKVKWILKNIKEDIFSLNGGRFLSQGSVYRLNRIQLSDVINILERYKINTKADLKENKDNYVFIIDEINRVIFLRYLEN
jgi:5-methylcytosine-specific restriction protein B